MDLNNVCLTGRLTKEIELRTTATGTEVVSFTLAIDDYSKDKDNNTYFINCVAWNHQAKFLNQYCNKGNLLAISGKLTSRSFERKDGTKGYAVEVVCNQVINTTPKNQNYNQSEQVMPTVEKTPNFDASSDITLAYNDDDLPF